MDNEYKLTSEQITELAKLSRDELCAVIERKYFELVSYARKPPAEDEAFWGTLSEKSKDGVRAAGMEIEKKYPLEVSRLYQDTNWHHGFNSGVLAIVRVLWGWDTPMTVHNLDNDCEEIISVQETREYSIEEFPFLDT